MLTQWNKMSTQYGKHNFFPQIPSLSLWACEDAFWDWGRLLQSSAASQRCRHEGMMWRLRYSTNKGKIFWFFFSQINTTKSFAGSHSQWLYGKKKKTEKKTHRHKSRRCVGGKWAKWERRKERVKQVDVWVSAVLCLALIGELGKEWCSSVHPSTGCASPPDLTKP